MNHINAVVIVRPAYVGALSTGDSRAGEKRWGELPIGPRRVHI